jgi:O-antigen/teichoic acid export membrane protein
MIGMRWSIRGIGLISTIILARLLVPEDFGIVAMAMLVVGLIEVLSESGQRYAVIREPNPDRESYDTAWTILVLQGIVLAAIIFAAAPLGAWYFEEPRSENLLYFLALRPLINGFQNIGTVAFLKDFEFQKDFRFGVYQKIIPVIITIALAWYLRNYWALAYGIVAGSLAGVVLSYLMHPYRPHFCLSRARRILGFSISILFQAISHFVSQKTDEFVVGGQYGAQSMGFYSVASDVGTSATGELTVPMSRALFPIYARLAYDPKELAATFGNALAAVAVLAFASGVGVFAVAEPLVLCVLGENWLPAATLLSWLALNAAAMEIANACFPTLNAMGHERMALRLSWLRTLGLVVVLVPAAHLASIEVVAAGRFALMTAFLPVFLVYTSRRLGVPLMTSFRAIWRPAVAAVLMAVAIKLLPFENVGSVYLQLVSEVSFGAIVFTSALTMLWLISGRPAGFERSAFGFFASLRQGLVRP